MKEMDDQYHQLQQYMGSLERLKKKITTENSNVTRNDRNRVNTYAAYLTGGDVPPGLALVVATLYEPRKQELRVASFHGDSSGGSGAPKFEMSQVVCDFEAPLASFFAPEAEDDQTHWHGEIFKFAAQLTEQAIGYFEQAAIHMNNEPKCTHALAPLDAHEFQFNPPGSAEFNIIGQTKPYVVAQQCLKYSQNLIEAIPTAGVGQWITFILGAGSVIVIDLRNVIDAGKSLETLHEYLEKIDEEVLAKCPFFGCGIAGSVWIPTGSIAIVVGIPPEGQEEAETVEKIAYIVKPCLDLTAISKIPGVVRAEIRSHLARGLARSTKALAADTPTWKEFMKQMPSDTESPQVLPADKKEG
jgi:hypothetical protein